jgi:hypothetical protein
MTLNTIKIQYKSRIISLFGIGVNFNFSHCLERVLLAHLENERGMNGKMGREAGLSVGGIGAM